MRGYWFDQVIIPIVTVCLVAMVVIAAVDVLS